MKKIYSDLLVCKAEQSQQLIGLGILPVACMCFESEAGQWVFGGEYLDQAPVIPAWTMQELCIMIGGDFPKPDIYCKQDWNIGLNMMQWAVYLPSKRLNFINGAEATAAFLEFLLRSKLVTAEECNARLEAFITKENFNPERDRLAKEAEERNK